MPSTVKPGTLFRAKIPLAFQARKHTELIVTNEVIMYSHSIPYVSDITTFKTHYFLTKDGKQVFLSSRSDIGQIIQNLILSHSIERATLKNVCENITKAQG